MPRISNIMSTTIDINTIKASNSLKSLNSAIRTTTNAWKANEARAKSVGNYYEAAKSRYEGLGKNIENVKSKIQYLSNQQQKLDRTTKQGQESYNQYANKLATAEKQLASLTAQQKRAKSSVDYQKRGLAGLQSSYKSLNDLANSRISRMRAEGHEVEANRTQINTYRSSITNLTKQQKLQSDELKRIAQNAGTSSEAYRKQEIRLNQTSTTLAKTKNAMNNLDESMHKANPSIFDRIKAKLSGLNGEAEKTHSTFKEVFMGSALGNALSNSLSNVGSDLMSAYHNGMNLNLALSKVNGRFHDMGLSRRQISAMDKQMSELKGNTLMTGENVANVQSKMLGWSNIGTKGAMQMTKMIAGVGDSSRITGDQIEQLGIGLTRVGSTGKVTYSALNRVTKLAPTFMTQLARGAGMSEGKLKALLRTGKVTQTQFQRWMANAAKYSNTAFSKFGTTQAGAMEKIKSKWDDLERKMTAPIFSAKTTGLQALKDLLTSKTVTNGAKAIGNGIANVIRYLDQHKKDISDSAKDLLSITGSVAKGVWKDSAAIVGDIGKGFGLIHGNAKKSAGPLHEVRLTLDGLAKNKGAIHLISNSIVAIAAVKGLGKVSGGLLGIASHGYQAYKNIKALHAGFKGIEDVKEFKGPEKAFVSLGRSISHTKANLKGLFGKGNGAGKLNGLLQSMHSAKGFKGLTTAGKVGNIAAGAGIAVDTATSIVKAIRDKAGSTKQYEDIGTGAGKAIGGGIGLYFGGPLGAAIGAKIGAAIGKWGGDSAKSFQNGWNKKKPPRKFWSWENFGWSTHDAINKAGKWGSSLVKATSHKISKGQKSIGNAWKHTTKDVGKFNSSVKKNLDNFGRSVEKNSSKAFNAPSKLAKKGWDEAYKHSSRGTKQIMRGISGFAKRYVKTNKEYTSATQKNFGSFSKRLKKNHGDLFKTIGQTTKTQLRIERNKWRSEWNNIHKSTKSIWHGINQNANDLYKKLNRSTHGGLGKVLTGFHNFGSGLKSFWDHLWNGIFKTVNDTIKKIQEAGKDADKFFHGKLKVGNLHLANGTNWRRHWGMPVVVNDAPGENYREGLINADGSITALPKKRNLRWWLFPGQDIINGQDMANLFGKAIRYANGTVKLKNIGVNAFMGNTTIKQLLTVAKKHYSLVKKEADKRKKKRDDDKKRHDDNKRRRDRRDRESKKSHKDMVYVDKSIFTKNPRKLTGHYVQISKSRLDHILDPYKYIAKAEAEKAKKKREKAAKKRKKEREKKRRQRERTKRRSTRRTSTTSSRSTSSSSRTSAVVTATVSGGAKVSALSRAISKLKGKHKVSITASAKGSKKISSLRKVIAKVKGNHKVIVKTRVSGTKSVKKLGSSIKNLQSKVRSLYKALAKEKIGNAIEKQAVKAVNSLKGKGNFSKQFGSMTKRFNKDLDDMQKNSEKRFRSMWSSILKRQKSGTREVLSDQSRFDSKSRHDWTSLENATANTYGRFWKVMYRTAHKGLGNVIGVLNTGIRRIDKVVHEFGGKDNAVHTVKFATGTGAFNGLRRKITKPTLSILNDGHDSPETGNKETIWDTRTNEFGVVHGKNVPFLLQPGQEVLNATESRLVGFTHFAQGTGASLKKLYHLANHYNDKPRQTGRAMFKLSLGNLNGAIRQLASGMKKQGENQGVRWWSQLWKMVNDKINDGDIDAKGLLKAVEHYGEGHRYVWGGSGPTVFDCSGLVMYALEHKYGIRYPHYSGAQYARTEHIPKSKAKMGDLVFWGKGGSEHVGVYAGGNRYFSAESPSQGIHMNSLGSVVGYAGPYFGRVRGLKQDDDSNEPKVKADNKLQKLIKAQVGKSFWKVINKIAEKYGDADYGGNSVTEGMIEAAARRMHVHLPDGFAKDVLRVALSESGNRNIQQQIHDVNSGGNEAQGPLQWTPGTFRTFAVAGHRDIHKPYDQLLAFFNNSDWRHSIGWTTIWGHRKFDWLHSGPQGHPRFANGGIVSSPRLAMVGEGRAPETIIPWDISQRSRAYKLMNATLKHFESDDKQDVSADSGLNSNSLKMILDAINNLNQTMMMFATQPINLKADTRMDSRLVAQSTYKWIRQMFARASVRGRSNFSGR